MRVPRCCAQSLIEYVMLISIVTMALTVMFPMIKRAVQSVVKTGADQIGDQSSTQQSVSSGYMSGSDTAASTSGQRTASQGFGQIGYQEQSVSSSNTNTASIIVPAGF